VRLIWLFVVGCGGASAPAIQNRTTSQPASSACGITVVHTLPAVGATLSKTFGEELGQGWQFIQEPPAVTSHGVTAHPAVDAADGASAMIFLRDHRFIGAVAPPTDYLMTAQPCDDGFVLEAESPPPMPPKYRRVVFAHGCSASDWNTEKLDCSLSQ
jgi:hypothetical protein